MVSSVGSSINSLLAANFSQLGQTASAQQIRAEELAAKARLQAEEALKARETVLPVSLDGRSPNQGSFVDIDQRRQSLRDFNRPKAELSPSDELLLFGVDLSFDAPVQAEPAAATVFEQGSDGIFYAVNDNSAAQAQAATQPAALTRQQQVAELYQRNYKAQFDGAPVYTLAA